MRFEVGENFFISEPAAADEHGVTCQIFGGENVDDFGEIFVNLHDNGGVRDLSGGGDFLVAGGSGNDGENIIAESDSIALAADFWFLAAEKGCTEAMLKLGDMYKAEGMPEAAEKYYRRAAENDGQESADDPAENI